MSDVQTQQPWADAEVAARELERRLSLKVLRNEPLTEHTTMRVGGPADLLVTIRDRFALRGLVRLAASRGWPLRILGRGSNVVVGDAGSADIAAWQRARGVASPDMTIPPDKSCRRCGAYTTAGYCSTKCARG